MGVQSVLSDDCAFRNKTGPKKEVEHHGVCGASQTR